MKRNKTIDIIRAIAILLVVIYHIYAITGLSFHIPVLDTFILYGGILGVTLFFILSGYGIYNSLKKQELSKKPFRYHDYLVKRLQRIAPQYYFSLFILLLFTGGVVYLAKSQLFNLVSHTFFFHNIYYEAAGAISGVCWTLGVIFQFYLLAPLLYKFIEKRPKLTLLLSLMISIGIKIFLFHFVFSKTPGVDSLYYFNYARQIYTAIDCFIIGMYIAKIRFFPKETSKHVNIIKIIESIFIFILIYIFLYLLDSPNLPFKNTGIHSDCLFGYLGYSILALLLGSFLFVISNIKCEFKSWISKFFLFISKFEYGIYIWHLIIITTLVQASPTIQNLMNYHSPIFIYMIFTFLSIFVGCIMSLIFDQIDYKKLLEENKEKLHLLVKLFLTLLIVFCIYKTILIIKPMIHNWQTYNQQKVVDQAPSKKIADHANQVIKNKNKCKYIYLDQESTGYLYFFQLRYYLSPCESIHYSDYAYLINYTDIDTIYKYLKDQDIDYVIIKENDFLTKKLGMSFDSVNGSIFRINRNANQIEDFLIEMEEK